MYAQVKATEKVIDTIAGLINTRNFSMGSKGEAVAEQVNNYGLRFPINNIYQLFNTQEMQVLARQKIVINMKKEPQVWLYYFPSTQHLKSKFHTEYFTQFFPSKSEKFHVQSVENHPDTEMLCIALHDNGYDKDSKRFVTESHVISAISFRMLSAGKYTGVYIYYLARLSDVHLTMYFQ